MESEQKTENFEVFEKTPENDEIKKSNESNGGQIIHHVDKENEAPNKEAKENNIRRHDEPSELSFEICKQNSLLLFYWIDDFINIFTFVTCSVPENQEEKAKRRLIEDALKDPNTPIEKWREFAKSEYGLINGKC